ncbi:MAG TPA: transposase [Candidatus Angelobacter sp.]|jgi:putative transposase
MVKLTRKSDRRNIIAGVRTFFAGCKSYMDQPFFRAQNEAELFIDVLRSNTLAGKFKVREFVVMPDHFHVLVTLDGNISIERAMQLIKGGYSFRRNKELGLAGEIWPPGYSEVRVLDRRSYLAHKKYIDENPVKAGLAKSAEEYPYCSAYFRKKKKASG